MVHLIVYEDPNQFWTEVSPHLKVNEAMNSLSLGLAYAFRTNPTDCLYQSALFDKDRCLGALICSRYKTNHNLLPTPLIEPSHAGVLLNRFKNTGICVTNIVGEVDTVGMYKKIFDENGVKTKVHMQQGIYRCRRVVSPPNPGDILFRKAEIKDLPQIADWIECFHRESIPHDPPIDGVEFANAKIKNNMVYVVEKEGSLVSMACWGRDIETSCSINGVYTPKHMRGNGYASVVTAQLTQFLLSQGKQETNLYTDLTNPTSNKIYQNIGYEFVCNSIHLGVQ
jgi:hypothetical protein